MKPVSPNIVMPMIRKVFPSMMSSSLEPGIQPGHPYPLIEKFAKEIGGWNFLSKRRLKHQIPNLQFNLWQMSINKVICTDGKPTHFTSRTFNLLNDAELDDFVAELGNLADLHGIIKLKRGVIWVKQVTDPSQLNIEPRILDGIMNRILEECKSELTIVMDDVNANSHAISLKVMT